MLEQKPHALFKRIGTDLVMDKKISLAQALTGTSFDVPTLEEGRSVRVRHAAGTVVRPDSWMRVADEGMPTHGRPYEKGNLYIHYSVEFPDAVSQEQVKALRRILGVGEEEDEPANASASSPKAGSGSGGSGSGGGGASTSASAMDADGTTSVHADGDGVDVVLPSAVSDIETELQQRRSAARAEEGGASYASSDDEDGGGGRGGRGVQCAQQ